MSRIGWSSLLRQLSRAEAGWRPLVAAVALGYALTVMAFALGNRVVQHMGEMAALPPEARLQIVVSAYDSAGSLHSVEQDLSSIRAVPEVQAAGWFDGPLRSLWWRPELFASGEWGIIGWNVMADDAADETLALKLVAGRLLQPDDLKHGPIVPILATRSFLAELGDGAWVGTRVRSLQRGLEAEVVGVVEDFLSHGHLPTSRNTVVWPSTPTQAPEALYLVRVEEAQLPAVKKEIERVLSTPGRLVRVERMSDVIAQAHGWADRAQGVLHVFAAAIILTVVLGTIAVCAFRVVERRRQLGILRAIGARKSDVAALVVAESTLAAFIGILFGIVLVFLMHSVLVTLVPFLVVSGRVLLASALLFLGASALAALVPALMATRVPPSIASRAA